VITTAPGETEYAEPDWSKAPHVSADPQPLETVRLKLSLATTVPPAVGVTELEGTEAGPVASLFTQLSKPVCRSCPDTPRTPCLQQCF
jgi:hypothetical protein